MNRAGRHALYPANDDAGRQAPSPIIDACQRLIPWHYLLTLGWLAGGAVNLWARHMQQRMDAVFAQLQVQRPEPIISPAAVTLMLIFIPLTFAFLSLRLAWALQKFARTGLISDLHPAMKRLRAVWRAYALMILIVAALVIVAAGVIFVMARK